MAKSDKDTTGPGTRAVWSGETGRFADNAAVMPVVHAVNYSFDTLEQLQAVGKGEQQGHLYSRSSNPTVAVFEEKMRVLEQAEAATSFASGMAAISNTLFGLLTPGQKVLSTTDTYGGTGTLFDVWLPRYGITVKRCPTDTDTLLAELVNGYDLLYLETPTNPLLKLLDLEKLCLAARATGTVIVVDNTVATPINQQPLVSGADVVVHSATKFIGGHSDVIAGAACGRQDLIKKIFDYREITGACLDPAAAYLLIRGIKTLELRVERHNSNALKMAQWLQSHPKVDQVNYPGLSSHPQHALAKQQMSGFGGLFSFTLKGDFDNVSRFLNRLQRVHLAASLGSVETLAGPPSVTSHAECTPEQRSELGTEDNLIRCAIGIENFIDIRDDFAAALDALSEAADPVLSHSQDNKT